MSIAVVEKAYGKDEVLGVLDPLVAEWFSQYPDLTPPQRYAIVSIHEGKNTLIAAPTGSGKTLAAFLSIISELVSLARRGALQDQVYCVYVSPLRALNNDIYRNLLEPLESIKRLAEQKGLQLPEIRIAVRTGDTTSSERSRMLRKPPHILITTPESLSIVLVAPKFRHLLRGTRWVIVDEIHELCGSKRGVHLTLSLERLEHAIGRPPARIALSATINPLDEVARFLVGYDDEGRERPCSIVDTRFVKATSLHVDTPVEDLLNTPTDDVSRELYLLIKRLVRTRRTTLIFTNTRSGTERVVFQLQRLKAVDINGLAAHHSSLSRELRKSVEEDLKRGKMKVVVTSTSLELGIDVGFIDLVIQIGSPKSISRCLQRVGRSGHTLDRVSEGYLIALERDDLVEDAALAREALSGRLDRVHIPRNCLDVLAQHVVGMAVEGRWRVKDALKLVRRSYCYHNLPEASFRAVVKYLSGGYRDLESFRVYGKIWYDEVNDMFGRRGALLRAIYASNVGTIPDEVSVKVYTKGGAWVGSIEEEFLERLSPGDIFILGGRPYRFLYAKGLKAYVEPAYGEKPTVPSWFSELLPLSFDLGEAIGRLRREISSKISAGIGLQELTEQVMRECSCSERAARALINYMLDEKRYLESIGVKIFPDNHDILIEDYRDPSGRQVIIFNTVFGRRVNDALARAYAYQLASSRGVNVALSVTDHGFSLTLPSGVAVSPHWLVRQVSSDRIRAMLREAIRHTEMARRRFRHCATRGLMILRSYKGHEVSIARRQVNAQILLRLAEDLGDFPVLEETYREIMEDLMDVTQAEQVLREVEWGVRCFHIGPPVDVPSPFTHHILLQGLSDVVLMEDRRRLLKSLHESVLRRISQVPVKP